ESRMFFSRRLQLGSAIGATLSRKRYFNLIQQGLANRPIKGVAVTLPTSLNPPFRLLLGPGPSDAHPRVLSAMALPLLGHLDPAFLEIMNETQDLLRHAFHTKNRLTFPISATGMAGMETCVVNLIEPGDKMVVCVAGFFGERIVEVASRAGAEVT